MTDDPGPGRLTRFPALDPEPPPRPWWWRALLPVAATMVVIAAAAAVVQVLRPAPGVPSSVSHQRAARPALAAPGLIVVALPSGLIGTARPDGTGLTPEPNLGSYGSGTAAALDNRYLTLGDGQLISIDSSSSGVILIYQTAVGIFSSESSLLDPFADHDTRLVLLADPSGTPTGRNSIRLATIPEGISHQVGTGDAVAGDPAADGAFVSVASARHPGRQGAGPDSMVELLRTGRPAEVLATAAELNHDLGRRASSPVVLTPYPSASGDRVAVTINPLPGSETGGIVVLSRTGEVLGARAIPQGPLIGAAPAWSASGHSLAYAGTGARGTVLRIWIVGGAGLTEAIPHPAHRYDTCTWSPDGQWVLCDAAISQTTDDWAVGRAAGGSMVPVRGPGHAITWLP